MLKKIILIAVIVVLAAGIIVGSSFGIVYGVVNKTDVSVKFDEAETYQTFTGFGASSAWTFRPLGRDFSEDVQNQVIELLYGESGLGLDIFRYNLGGGSTEVEGCNYDDDRKAESFFDASKFVDYSSFANEANYDFTKDSAYVSMMLKSFEMGNIRKLVIFSNSPHYLMTKNGKTNGTVELENNLKEDAYEAFSDYVLVCAKNIKKMLDDRGFNDVEIYLSPVNEPQWDWGGEYASQEGCHYDPEPLAKFYDVFYKKMTAFNQTNATEFKMDIYESGNYKTNHRKAKNKEYLKEFAKYDYFNEIEELSMHSYGADDSIKHRNSFMNYADKIDLNKKITISEYCVMEWGVDESVDRGIFSSKIIMRDLSIMNACEWSWWLALAFGGYEDGLLYLDKESNEITLTYRYYMYKNIMDYIDVGDVRVKTELYDPFGWGGLDTVAFKKPTGELVIIVLNDSEKDRTLTYEGLDEYTSITKVCTSEEGKLVESEVKEISSKMQSKAKSITTYILSK